MGSTYPALPGPLWWGGFWERFQWAKIHNSANTRVRHTITIHSILLLGRGIKRTSCVWKSGGRWQIRTADLMRVMHAL